MKHVHTVSALEAFYREVVELTFNHEEDTDNKAWVSPAKLGKALERVDTEWYELVGKPIGGKDKK